MAQLRQLEGAKRIFELRRMVDQLPETAETRFCRAMVTARMGLEVVGIEQLRKILEAAPDREVERKVHEELASALARIGRYSDAASEWAEALRLRPQDDPGRRDAEDTRMLYASLRDASPQTIEFEGRALVKARHNPFGSWTVPVSVNGVSGEWLFDTGANFSTLKESEAMKMGLAINGPPAYVSGLTGKRIPIRTAVAAAMRFGSARLRNVVFLVVADDVLPKQMPGILGLPVIRALGFVEISDEGLIRTKPSVTSAQGEPNLYFDELAVVVEIQHGRHAMQVVLDSGANPGFMYPSFRDALDKDEIAQLKRRNVRASGAGETIARAVEVVPSLRLQLPGKLVNLRKISILEQQPAGSLHFEDGVIGMDALAGGFALDFNTMQLRLN